tara:strand:+ start:64 stop:438 length:375 start_codon:yes stop_codon:yes gene_type:complete
MLIWIVKQIVISLLIIVLAHSIYVFLQNNLTTPKIRDLVDKPRKQYNDIYNNIDSITNNKIDEPNDLSTKNKITNNEDKSNNINMKHELQEYLNELSKNVTNNKVVTANLNNNFTSQYETIQTI